MSVKRLPWPGSPRVSSARHTAAVRSRKPRPRRLRFLRPSGAPAHSKPPPPAESRRRRAGSQRAIAAAMPRLGLTAAQPAEGRPGYDRSLPADAEPRRAPLHGGRAHARQASARGWPVAFPCHRAGCPARRLPLPAGQRCRRAHRQLDPAHWRFAPARPEPILRLPFRRAPGPRRSPTGCPVPPHRTPPGWPGSDRRR